MMAVLRFENIFEMALGRFRKMWPDGREEFCPCINVVGTGRLRFSPLLPRDHPWNLPSNPVDREQRDRRIHRFKGHGSEKILLLRTGAGPCATLTLTYGKKFSKLVARSGQAKKTISSRFGSFRAMQRSSAIYPQIHSAAR
jgi:hypothetical protein